MNRLLINRVSLRFKYTSPLILVVESTDNFVVNKCKTSWIRDRLSYSDKDKFVEWITDNDIDENSYLSIEFKKNLDDYKNHQKNIFYADLTEEYCRPFIPKLLKQELTSHLINKGLFIQPIKIPLDFCAYEKVSEFNNEYDQYRRVDFLWKHKRNELIFNFGSERTLISRENKNLEDGEIAFNPNDNLVNKKHGGIRARAKCPREIQFKLFSSPIKFSYKDRYKKLASFSASHLYDLNSDYFSIDKTGFKNVEPDDLNFVYKQQNLMTFGNEKTAVNAVIGMREHGPLHKAVNSENKRLLFIYQNRNDANTLYRYLKNGHKHFPGLLSYVGIPVALAGPDKGCPYKDAASLPSDLEYFLNENYHEDFYPDTVAIVIGPFRKYESDEAESEAYYQVKKMLLEKSIASQFVSSATLNSYGIHYSLPNIAIAILAKCGGVPWKLSTKAVNELVVGFNTKPVGSDRYLGSAVFFTNEGKLGGIRGLPVDDKAAIIHHLKQAITEYTSISGEPDRLVIHYYKPPRADELNNIDQLLKEMGLSIPIAVIEINDSKSKLDVCFDTNFDMGMPESGAFVKTGYNEYLLFNNNRYKKSPTQKIDDELPIKLKLSYVNTGGFSTNELIAQVYEFSRLNWKGLKQRSAPVTITYSKMIAEFSSYFDGEIPENDVARTIPWFI